jgi:hypothetical protein
MTTNPASTAAFAAAPFPVAPPAPATADALAHAARMILPHLERGQLVDAPTLRGVMVSAFGGSDAVGAWDWKTAYDACEAATVLFLRKFGPAIRAQASSQAAMLPMLSKIAGLFPTNPRRSEESQELKQFSTPIALGLAAGVAAAITPVDLVLEPSAGTGLLAILAELAGGSLVLNELAETRAGLLDHLLPDIAVTRHDAARLHDHIDADIVPSVVLINPLHLNTRPMGRGASGMLHRRSVRSISRGRQGLMARLARTWAAAARDGVIPLRRVASARLASCRGRGLLTRKSQSCSLPRMFDGATLAGCSLLADPSGLDEGSAKAVTIQLMAQRLIRLGEIAEVGMKMIRSLAPDPAPVDVVAETAKPAPPPRPAADYDRLARSVRLTLRFEAETAQALCDLVSGDARAKAARETGRQAREEAAAEERRKEVRSEVEWRVRAAAEAEITEDTELDDLDEALEERLDHDEAYQDLEDRPLREVVEALCHDLALSPDFSDWTDDDFALPEDRVAPRPRGSPFERPSRKPVLVTGPAPMDPYGACAGPPAAWRPYAGGP